MQEQDHSLDSLGSQIYCVNNAVLTRMPYSVSTYNQDSCCDMGTSRQTDRMTLSKRVMWSSMGRTVITTKPSFGLHFLVCSWHVEPNTLLCTISSSWLLLQVWQPSASLVDKKDRLACAEVPSRVGNDKH